MNILQVCTYDIFGGAAKVAYRLHQEFKKMGHTSKMAVGLKTSQDPDVLQFGLGKYINKVQQKIEYYTGIQTYASFQDKYYFHEADIIHFHNLHGDFFNITEVAEVSQKKPTVWTLHDEWATTGHCAYTFEDDCRKWITGCGDCPRLGTYPAIRKDITRRLWQTKKSIYLNSNLHIVTPCHWLKEKVEQSILSHFKIMCIPNGIDEKKFCPTDKKDARTKLGLLQNKKIIAFNAVYPESEFKGFSNLTDALKKLPAAGDFALLVLGGKKPLVIPAVGFEAFNPGYIKNEATLALYYSAADVFVLPSLAETAPLVVLEAMACGLPVAAFDVGGVAEAVSHKKNGYVARYKDSDDLACGIQWVLEDEDRYQSLAKGAREKVESKFSLGVIARQYIGLYTEILEKQN